MYQAAVVIFAAGSTLAEHLDLSCQPRLARPTNVMHTCIQDVYKAAEAIRAAGGILTKEPGPAGPGIPTKICATTDPDGWKVVLVSA